MQDGTLINCCVDFTDLANQGVLPANLYDYALVIELASRSHLQHGRLTHVIKALRRSISVSIDRSFSGRVHLQELRCSRFLESTV